jgi:hypothetical protein
MTVLASRRLAISIRANSGQLYYVMASSQTLGDALKRVARYNQITNEAKWRDLSERKWSSALMGLKFGRRCSASRRGDQITVQRRVVCRDA